MEKVFTGYDYNNNKIKVVVFDSKIEKVTILNKNEIVDDVYIIPGFIDIHTLGGYGFDWLTPDIEKAKKYLNHVAVNEGVTSVVGAILTHDINQLKMSLREFSPLINKKLGTGASFLGWHIIGPFITDRGVFYDKEDVKKLTFYNLNKYFDEYIQDIKIISLAPEDVSDDVLSILEINNIKMFAGHTKAQKEDVIGKPISGITHYNQDMIKYGEKNDSLARYALKSRRIYIEYLNDGKHNPYKMSKKIYKLKDKHHIILITGSLHVKGLPDGRYMIFGKEFIKKGDEIVNRQNQLAGSIYTMFGAFKDWFLKVKATLEECVLATSTNAANLLKLNKGQIKRGYDADILLIERKTFKIKEVYVMGEKINDDGENIILDDEIDTW